MKLKSIVLSTLILFGTVGCLEPDYDRDAVRVVEVTEHGFELNGQSAVTIFVGEKNTPKFSFTMLKSDLKKGTLLQSTSNSELNLAVSASVGSEYYTQSADFATSASLQVVELDKTNKIAKIAVGAKLVNPKIKNYTELAVTVVEVSGVNYDYLVK